MRSTPVTAKLSRKFYDAMGDDVANELVDWFNAVDLTYHEPITQGAHSHLRHQGDALTCRESKEASGRREPMVTQHRLARRRNRN